VYGTITFIDVSPLNPDIIYAGTDDGKVWNTLNGGASWTQVDDGLPVRWVTCVETDPFDESTAYVTISGYRFHDNMNHVYKTTDNGQTWTDIGSTLPDVPCNNIIADPAAQGTYYLATDVGVYYTLDEGANWYPAGTGMPLVPCVDLKLHQPTRTLVAGTYGRGLYKLNLDVLLGVKPASEISITSSVYPNPVTGDFLQVAFTLPQKENLTISLFDMSGKLLVHKNTAGTNGRNLYKLNMKETPAGIYLIHLEAGHYSSTFKVMME
jgi:hypothetical protein